MADNNDRVQMIEKAQEGIRVLSTELTRLAHQSEQAEFSKQQMEDAAGKLQVLHDQLAQTITAAGEQAELARGRVEEAAGKLQALQEQLGQTAAIAGEQFEAQQQQLKGTINSAGELLGSHQQAFEADRQAMRSSSQELAAVAPALAERMSRLEKGVAAALGELGETVHNRLTDTRAQFTGALTEQAQKTMYSVEELSARTSKVSWGVVLAVVLSLAAAAGSWISAVLLYRGK